MQAYIFVDIDPNILLQSTNGRTCGDKNWHIGDKNWLIIEAEEKTSNQHYSKRPSPIPSLKGI